MAWWKSFLQPKINVSFFISFISVLLSMHRIHNDKIILLKYLEQFCLWSFMFCKWMKSIWYKASMDIWPIVHFCQMKIYIQLNAPFMFLRMTQSFVLLHPGYNGWTENNISKVWCDELVTWKCSIMHNHRPLSWKILITDWPLLKNNHIVCKIEHPKKKNPILLVNLVLHLKSGFVDAN